MNIRGAADMKKMNRFRKLLALVLCAMMVIGLAPGLMPEAKAEFELYTLYVGGVDIVAASNQVADGKGGTATLSYENNKPVLTLKNYTFNSTGAYQVGIRYVAENDALTIRLVGTCSLIGDILGIQSVNSLRIVGNSGASLTVSGSTYGIDSHGSISIDNCTVVVEGSEYPYGIYAEESIDIKDSTVLATQSKMGGVYSYSGSVSITNSTVRAKASNYHGIHCHSEAVVTIDSTSVVSAAGGRQAISGLLKNAVAGTGWEDMEGTVNGKAIDVSESGQSLNYKCVKFPVTVSAPGFSPEAGTYKAPLSVSLSCATDGASIYYTTDGSNPTTDSAQYDSANPISFSSNTTVRAVAVNDGDYSSVASADYAVYYDLKYAPGEGGSGSMNPTVVNDGELYTFPACGFKADSGKAFDHWKMSGVDGIFNPGDTVTIASNCAANGVITVTAHWKDAAAVTKTPVAIDPAYSGKAQALVKAGEAQNGRMYYAIGDSTVTAPASGWSENIPEATLAGTYYVWYKAAGTGDCEDSEPGCCTAEIRKASMTVTAEGYTGIYDGQSHGIAVTVTDPAGGTAVKYGTSEESCSLDASPTLTDAGTLTVYYRVTAANYTDYTGSAAVTIGQAGASVQTPPAAAAGLICDGSAHELVTAGTASGGEMQYAPGTDGTTAPAAGWSTAIPKGTEAGTYYIWYKVVGDKNHLDSEPAFVTAVISTPTASYFTDSGEGAEWQRRDDRALTFIFRRTEDDTATFDHFTGIACDGRAVPERDASGRANWTARRGSLILTLNPSFLETLPSGNHTVTAVFDDGTASASFTVSENLPEPTATSAPAPEPTETPKPVPKTGDGGQPVFWICLILLGITGLAVPGVKKFSRKRK